MVDTHRALLTARMIKAISGLSHEEQVATLISLMTIGVLEASSNFYYGSTAPGEEIDHILEDGTVT